MNTKKQPLRMCIVTRELLPKNELIRVVKTPSGLFELDFTGKLSGRGAYLKNSTDTIERCIKTKALNKAFKENISNDVYLKIMESYASRTNKQS